MCAKKIAVLTSGGDAPGMNAAVRSVVRTAISFGMEVYGVKHGYNGLLRGEVDKMYLRSVSNIIQHGGTSLFTARSPEFNTPEGVQKAADKCRELGIDGVVVIGGDGSFRGARDLTGAGIPCIGVPGTIDNDISSSEYTIGYDTAMNTAMEMIDREGRGAVVYLNQEGRGIGLCNKIHAYKLQDEGLDTVDANLKLGFKADERDYGVGASIIRELGIRHMRLMTNNPLKRAGLEGYGLCIDEIVPIVIAPNPYNAHYLETKQERMHHTLGLEKR